MIDTQKKNRLSYIGIKNSVICSTHINFHQIGVQWSVYVPCKEGPTCTTMYLTHCTPSTKEYDEVSA
jgi:hypothetical protein